MKRFSLLLALVTVAVISVSCDKEIKNNSSASANEISFVLGSTQTKAASDFVRATSYDLGFERLELVEEISSLDDLYDVPRTKGTPAYSENLIALYGSFDAVAYKPATGESKISASPDLPDANYAYDANWEAWRHVYTFSPWEDYHEDGDGYWFFMRMGDMENTTDLSYSVVSKTINSKTTDCGQISFKYTSPASATDQQDILFASRFLTEADEPEAQILFYHALTGVKFKLDALGDKISYVKEINLKGLYDKGTCVMTAVYGDYTGDDSNRSGGADTRSAKCAVWTLDNTSTFTAKASFSEAEGKGQAEGTSNYSFPTSFSAGETASTNFNDVNFSKTFFLIPQVVDENVVLEVKLALVNGETITREFAFGKNVTKTNDWQAGELRTYTLKINNNIDIIVEEEFEDNIKSDVYVKNVGSSPAFVRVIIAANWVGTIKGDEMIVEPYEFNDDPSKMIGTWVEFPGNNWVKNGAYWYFTQPVGGGLTTTTPLFKSFTYTTDQAGISIAGAHLEMAIASQAVEAVDGQTWEQAWGIE